MTAKALAQKHGAVRPSPRCPLPPFPTATSAQLHAAPTLPAPAAAFPFFYIEPAKPEHLHITRKFAGNISKKEIEDIAPIGNSPTYMTFDDMKKVMPTWMNVSIAVFKDQEANSVWGWVQEMYGFTIALSLNGIKHADLFLHLMAQPPWDSTMDMAPNKPFYILHYTYGMDYKLTGGGMCMAARARYVCVCVCARTVETS